MNEFYRQYLNAEVERRGTDSEKWDRCQQRFGRADLLPMWVADMDFPTVPEVVQALVERAGHPIYGYTENASAEKEAEVAWLKRRHDTDVEPDWILYSPGVVDSLFFCVRVLTQRGDSILIQPPVYGPFYRAVELFERKLMKSPLLYTDAGWKMDFDSLERCMAQGVRMMILCNPHNPVGRVWNRDELQRLVDVARRYECIVVSDEIHADFAMGEARVTRILNLEHSEHCIMLSSATKSFNLAGLRQSSVVVKRADLREKISAEIQKAHADTPNIFGAIAQKTAYERGDAWMDAVVEYVRENRDYAVEFIRTRIPGIACRPQEGSYLLWLDCRNVGLSHEEFFERLVRDAGVALNSGLDYGEEGRGFFRFNLATQRSRVQKALEKIEEMVRSIDQ